MKIKVCVDDGAHALSGNTDIIEVEELGCTEAEWKALSEDGKNERVRTYWLGQGLPEIWFDDENITDEEVE